MTFTDGGATGGGRFVWFDSRRSTPAHQVSGEFRSC